MTKVKRYVYISDRKVNAYKDQLKRRLKLSLDWEVSFKLLLAELRGEIGVTQEADTIFQDLDKVIHTLENDHSIGDSFKFSDFNYSWIKMSGDFQFEVMKSERLSPHFRWLRLDDNGFEKQIIYLVGSLVYGLPRTRAWREPEDLYRHFDLCLDDLEAHDWDEAAVNLANEVLDYTGKLGVESRIETVFEVLHRSNPVEKWNGPYRVTFGTPLYVASIA